MENESAIWWTVYDFRLFMIKLTIIHFIIDSLERFIKYKYEKGFKISFNRREEHYLMTNPNIAEINREQILKNYFISYNIYYCFSVLSIDWYSLVLIPMSLYWNYKTIRISIQEFRALIKSKIWIYSRLLFCVEVFLQFLAIITKLLMELSLIIHFSIIWSKVFNHRNILLIVWFLIRPLIIFLFSILFLNYTFNYMVWYYRQLKDKPPFIPVNDEN